MYGATPPLVLTVAEPVFAAKQLTLVCELTDKVNVGQDVCMLPGKQIH